jgi:hypothetical protein
MTALRKEDLEQYDDEFREADEPEIGGNVPDGNYIVKVDAVEMRTSQNGNPYLNWDLLVVNGECEGRHLFRNNMLQTQQNLGYLKHDLSTCGVNIKSPQFKLSNFLTKHLNKLLDLHLEVTAKARRDDPTRLNVYLNKLVEADAVASATAESGETAGGEEDDFDPFGDS